MAGATLCVACAQLPTKDRSLAVKTQQCPECKATFGVTSYGAAFRAKPPRRVLYMTPTFFTGAAIGAGLFSFVVMLVGLGMWSHDQMTPHARSPETRAPNGLARVPEVSVTDTIPHSQNPAVSKNEISHFSGLIKRENDRKQDAFVLAQMDRRPELRGMPFVMGGACRLDAARAGTFQNTVEAARNGLGNDMVSARFHHADESAPFWNTYLSSSGGNGIDSDAGVAALTQVLGPERGVLRTSMIHKLARNDRPEATRTIAKAAIFDASFEVRQAALKELKKRQPEQYNDILMHGIRYPLTIVATRTAQAMIVLDRQDLVPQLVNFLGEAAPGDPEVVNEKHCVREVVRINHHRNCLLCHPPSQTGQPTEVPGVIPIPGMPFPSSPSEAYGNAQSSGEPMVRADTTYLRQDFSVRMPVENAAPWPEMQRFDFLVRTRIVEGKELASLERKAAQRPADFKSPNHQAAAHVLQELTGHQNVAATREAWERVFRK